jgi:hypothetical protein
VLEVLGVEKQTDDNRKKEDCKGTEVYEDKVINKSTNDITLSPSSTNYRYTIEDINNSFASNNRQGEEDHTLENSICRPLIGKQTSKPFFHYCKKCP